MQRIIKSKVKNMCSRPSNVSVLIKEGVFFYWKKSAFLKNTGVFFWPEISALGVFLKFDNEHMHPPKYLSDAPGLAITLH